MAKSIARSVAVRRRALRVKLRHIGWGAVEFVGGVLLVLSIAIGGLYWRLSQGDISLSFVTTPIENAINEQLTGYSVAIQDTVLERVDEGRGVSLRLKGLELRAPSGAVVAAAPKAEIGISFAGLVFGRILPQRIELIGAQLALIYDRRGRLLIGLNASSNGSDTAVLREALPPAESFSLAAADPTQQSDPSAAPPTFATGVAMFRDLLSGGEQRHAALRSMEEIGITHANAVFIHERMGRRWTMRDGSVRLSLRDGALHVEAAADLSHLGKPIPVRAQASLRNIEGGVEMSGTISDIVPHDLAESFGAQNLFVALDMPVTASFTADVADDGTLRGGLVDTVLGAGSIRVLGDDRDGLFLDEASLRVGYDARERVITVHPSVFNSGQSSATIEGRIFAGPRDGPIPDVWRYELRGRDVQLGAGDLSAAPIAVDVVSAQGSYDVPSGVLQLYRGELVAGDVGVALSAIVTQDADNPRVQLAGSASPMSAAQLKALWPQFVSSSGREWVLEHVAEGRITGATLLVDLDKDDIEGIRNEQPLDASALQMNFGIADVTATFIKEMPPLHIVSGKGQLAGAVFTLETSDAGVALSGGGRVELTKGVFNVPRSDQKGSEGFFDLTVSGGVGSLLKLLNHEPLKLASKWGIRPDMFSGDGEVALRLALPLIKDVPADQVKVEAEAELTGVGARNVIGEHDFSNGRLLVNVKESTFSLAGQGKVSGIDAKLTWSAPFDAAPRDDHAPTLTMELDDADRKALSLSLDGVSGPVSVTLAPNLGKGGKDGKIAAFAADLTAAAIDYPALSVSKQSGHAATVTGEVFAGQHGALSVERIELTSDTLAALGSLTLDQKGALKSLHLPVLRLSKNDNLSLNMERNAKGRSQVTLSGTSFDASNTVGSAMRGGVAGGNGQAPAEAVPPIDITFNLQRVFGRHGAEIRNVSGNASIEGGQIGMLDMQGSIDGGAQVQGRIRPAGANLRKLQVYSANAGAAFRFAGLYKRIEGGTLSLEMDLPNQPGANGAGVLKADSFFIRGEPVIRRISDSAPASADPKAVIDSSRIRFDRLRMPFETQPGRLVLSESVLRGPSVGGSVQGEINFAANEMNLAGTYVPAYAVNNLLSHVPIVGRVLMGGEAGGLVGVTFAVRGPLDEPVVTINPMSAITPGLFRKIFDFSPTGGAKPQQSATERKPLPSAPVIGQ